MHFRKINFHSCHRLRKYFYSETFQIYDTYKAIYTQYMKSQFSVAKITKVCVHINTELHFVLPFLQNTAIAHAKLADVLDPVMDLYEDVKRKCLMRLEYENLMKSEAITSPTSKFYQKPLDYAMWKYAYYVCHKCNKVKKSNIIPQCSVQ